MDMDHEAIAGAAQGDLADVVARASAMAALPSTSHGHHLQPPPPSSPAPAAADHMPASASSMADQILMNPYYGEDRRHAAVMFETAPSTVDPYLSSSVTAPRGGYWLPPQPLPVQISQQHACDGGRDTVMMTGAAAAGVEGEDSTRSSSLTPAVAGHQMMKRRKDVKKVVCIPAPPSTMNNRPGGGEVIPSDLWAWRKYGQKPIKGSPYPRYVLDQHHGKGNHKAMSILDDGMLHYIYPEKAISLLQEK